MNMEWAGREIFPTSEIIRRKPKNRKTFPQVKGTESAESRDQKK